jgi:hypothetical protein
MRRFAGALSVLLVLSCMAAAEDKIQALARDEPARANLTVAEVNALIERVRRCWNPPAGMNEKILVRFKLDKSGMVIGTPKVLGASVPDKEASVLAAAAKRAVLKCQPYALPAEKYDSWSEVIVNFATQ